MNTFALSMILVSISAVLVIDGSRRATSTIYDAGSIADRAVDGFSRFHDGWAKYYRDHAEYTWRCFSGEVGEICNRTLSLDGVLPAHNWIQRISPYYGFKPRSIGSLDWSYGQDSDRGAYFCLSGNAGQFIQKELRLASRAFLPEFAQMGNGCAGSNNASSQYVSLTYWIGDAVKAQFENEIIPKDDLPDHVVLPESPVMAEGIVFPVLKSNVHPYEVVGEQAAKTMSRDIENYLDASQILNRPNNGTLNAIRQDVRQILINQGWPTNEAMSVSRQIKDSYRRFYAENPGGVPPVDSPGVTTPIYDQLLQLSNIHVYTGSVEATQELSYEIDYFLSANQIDVSSNADMNTARKEVRAALRRAGIHPGTSQHLARAVLNTHCATSSSCN